MSIRRTTGKLNKIEKQCCNLIKEVQNLTGKGGCLEQLKGEIGELEQFLGSLAPEAPPEPSTPDPAILKEMKILQANNENLQLEIGKITEKYAPFENKIKEIQTLLYPEFIRTSENEAVEQLKNLLNNYFTGEDDQPELGLLLGQLQTVNALLGRQVDQKQLARPLRETGRLIVQLAGDAEPSEIQEALETLASEFSTHLEHNGLMLFVPRIGSTADNGRMVYSPGSGRVSAIRSWGVTTSSGVTILHAEVDC